jgi:uncharacterized protein (DUF433 family)
MLPFFCGIKTPNVKTSLQAVKKPKQYRWNRRFTAPTKYVKFPRMKSNDLITVDLDILGGTPVFKGTRVPVMTLFEYLENNYTLDEFLECFPSVTRELARCVLG